MELQNKALSKAKSKRIEWIQEYIRKHGPVDVLNAYFVDDYEAEFSAKVETRLFGANHCPELGKILSLAYKYGHLDREAVGIECGYPGMPRWVYVYENVK